MINKNDISKISRGNYELCCAYYNYEIFVKNITQNKIYKGYIINEVNIKHFKNRIKYDELKFYVENYDYKSVKSIIINYKCERFLKFILKDFDNSEDLIKELKNNKKRFYIINSDLFNSICVTNNGNKGIDFLIKEDKLILIFNENDKLTFKNNNCIIDISTLIKEDQNYQMGNKEINLLNQNYNSNNLNNNLLKNKTSILKLLPLSSDEKLLPKDNINEKDEKIIEIILLIYQFNKDLKNEINNSLNFKNNEEYKNKINYNKCYLIRKEWLNKFKNFYSYNKIEEYIKNKDLSEIDTNDIKMNNLIKEIINHTKIENVNNNSIQDINEEIIINLSISELSLLVKEENIYYPNNFYIINTYILKKIYKNILFKDYKKENDKKNNYIVNNGQIILKYEYKLNNNEIKYYNILFGVLNDNNIFIPQILLFFEKNENERNREFEKLKEEINIKYNINNPNAIKLDSILLFKFLNNNQINNEKE